MITNCENLPASKSQAQSPLGVEREQRLLMRMRAQQNSGTPTVRTDRPIPQIQEHELVRPIGAGAYGEVWLAKSVMGTCRAVKVVYRNSFNDSRPYEREFRGIQKFEPLSRSNDNLVDILQIGREDEQGYFYYVMELADDVAGDNSSFEQYIPKTLRSEVQRRGRLPFDECLQLALSLTLALGHLHRQGLIHRDIKPSNIIFIGGVPKLADIGLVTDLQEARSFVGTEGFIPPEGPNSRQADIYSLGKVLYEISMGKDRLDFPEPFTALGQGAEWEDLEELNAVILKACASAPQERYQSAEEMHVDLALLQSGKSVKGKRLLEKNLARARKVAVVVGLIATLAAGGYLFQRQQTRKTAQLAALGDIKNAESALDVGESAFALAQLADVLRRHPDNRVAAQRIFSALAQRNFPQMVTQPLIHESQVVAARFSPDGKKIASASGDLGDYMLHIWDTQSGGEAVPPIRHVDRITSLAFSPDGLKVLTTAGRGASIWDLQTGKLAIPTLNHPNGVRAAAFSPDGLWIGTAGVEGNARIFNSQTGELAYPPLSHVMRGRAIAINSIVFDPNGQIFATGTTDGSVRTFETRSGEQKHIFENAGEVNLLQFSPDGKWLAAAIQGPITNPHWYVQAWRTETGQPLIEPLPHENRLYTLGFSPDSQRIVVATANNVARVWDIAQRKLLFELPHKALVYSASFSPDGSSILTSSVDDTARLWDAANGNVLSEPMLHDDRVIHAEFSPNGQIILTAGWDSAVRLWKVPQNLATVQSFPHPRWVRSAQFDRTGSNILTATTGLISTAKKINSFAQGEQQVILLSDATDGTVHSRLSLARGAEPLIAQFTDLGARALVAEPTDRLRARHATIWNVGKKMRIGAEVFMEDGILCAQFSSDGTKLATGSNGNQSRLWNAEDGTPLGAPMLHHGKINSVRFSPDNRLLLTASDDGTAVLWDTRSGQPAAPALKHQRAVWMAQFNRSGDQVVTASFDHFVRVWSTNGTLIVELKHPTAIIEYAEFSPDGRMIVTASGDSRARLWNAATGRPLKVFQHGQSVISASFSPDGSAIITASLDSTAQLWDAATGLKLADPFRHGDWVLSALFSPDGRFVLTASADDSARIWRVPVLPSDIPAWLPDFAETVAGQRINAQGISERISWEQYSRLRTHLPQTSFPDH
jgi:WD40 repeat protein